MTAKTLTVIHAHDIAEIGVRYVTDPGSPVRWTNLSIGSAEVTVYGDHAATSRMLAAAAAQCPDAPTGDLTDCIEALIAAARQAGAESRDINSATVAEIPVRAARQRLYDRLARHGLDGTGWIPEPEADRQVCLEPTRSGPCTLAAGHLDDHVHIDTVALTEAEHTEAEVLRDERDRALDQLDQAGATL